MSKHRGDRAMPCALCGVQIGDDSHVTYKFKLPRRPKIAWHMACANRDEVWNVIRLLGPEAAVAMVESRAADRVKRVAQRKVK